MKIILLGCGMIGSVIAEDFSSTMDCTKIIVADRDCDRAKSTASKINGATPIKLDVTNYPRLVEMLKGFDIAVGALPGNLGLQAIKAAIEAEVDMVDVSFTPEDALMLDEAAKEANVTVIPDCGVAPGLSNMLVGYASNKLDRIGRAYIMVGGIPEHPVPPLGYTVTWSAEGLIDEYTRDVNIVEGAQVVKVAALSGLEEIEFPGVGKLEAFYTDGLRSLIQTFQGVESMWEKTLRYPGHVEKIKLLDALGFFDEASLTIEGVQVTPRKMTARLLERHLRRPEIGDILAMLVEVTGKNKGKSSCYKFQILDRYDHVRGVTAMARTTAYTASIIAQKLALDAIDEKGVIPPEKLGMDEHVFESLLQELRDRGVAVNKISPKSARAPIRPLTGP